MTRTVATIRTFTFVLSLILQGSVFATDITFTVTDASPYCGASTTTLNYDASACTFTAGNTFNVELSDATGSFTSPLIIGSLSSTTQTGSIQITFPASASGTAFRIRVTSSSPAVVGSDNGHNLKINPVTKASVTIDMSQGNPLCDTHIATFTATPTGGGPSPNYQWKKNGVNVGKQSSSYRDAALNDGDDVYIVMNSNQACAAPVQAESNHIIVVQKRTATPEVTISGPSVICQGIDAQFTATIVNGGTSPSYQWKKDGVNVGTDSSIYRDSSLIDGDVISCVLTSNRECISSPTANSNNLTTDVKVIVMPTMNITAEPAGVVGAGSVVYVSSKVENGGDAPEFEWKCDGVIVGNSNSLVLPDLSCNTEITAVLTSNADCAQQAIVESNLIDIVVDTSITKSNHAWAARAPHGDARSNASGFNIGNKAYVGVGFVSDSATITYRKDFWEYDPATDVWTQKADFGGTARCNAVGFSIGSKGYIGTGITAAGVKKDFWAYDPTTNTWVQRQNIPGAAREQAFGFAIGNKGYIGGGYSKSSGEFQDFYEFDPLANTWNGRADFGGGKRMGGAGFTIDTKGYVAGGRSSTAGTWYKDLWSFDQANNVWTQRADFPGDARAGATAFALAGYGYIGLGNTANGYDAEFFQYTVATDSWTRKPFFPGPSTINFGTGIVVGNRSYVFKDGTWSEYNIFTALPFSSKACTGEILPVNVDASGFSFGADNVFTAQLSPLLNFSVATIVGKSASAESTATVNVMIPSSVSSGLYYFRVTSSNPPMTTLLETIKITSVPITHSITSQSGDKVCRDASVTFTSSLSTPGIQWYRNDVVVGTDSETYTDNTLASGDTIRAIHSYTSGCIAPVSIVSNPIVMTIRNPAPPTINFIPPNTLRSSEAVDYQWYENGSTIPGATSQTYKIPDMGLYKVRTTDGSGCSAFSDDIRSVYAGFEDDDFKLDVNTYPSPFINEVTLELSDQIVAQGCDFSLVNELGQTVVTRKSAEKINAINMSGKAPGIYLIKVMFGEKAVIRRVVKI